MTTNDVECIDKQRNPASKFVYYCQEDTFDTKKRTCVFIFEDKA